MIITRDTWQTPRTVAVTLDHEGITEDFSVAIKTQVQSKVGSYTTDVMAVLMEGVPDATTGVAVTAGVIGAAAVAVAALAAFGSCWRWPSCCRSCCCWWRCVGSRSAACMCTTCVYTRVVCDLVRLRMPPVLL